MRKIGTLAVGGMKNRRTSDDNFVALHHPKRRMLLADPHSSF
jgi:hypothetical protein